MYSKVWFTWTTKRLIGHTTKTVLLWNDRKFSIWTHWLVNQGISTSAIYQKGSSSYENQTVIKSTDIWQIIWLSLFQKIWYSFFPSRHSLLAEHYPPPSPPPPPIPYLHLSTFGWPLNPPNMWTSFMDGPKNLFLVTKSYIHHKTYFITFSLTCQYIFVDFVVHSCCLAWQLYNLILVLQNCDCIIDVMVPRR